MKITELFSSIQGEGKDTGRLCTFIRFSGCNLKCSFCDTNHSKYMNLAPSLILQMVGKLKNNFVVLTGGEPGIHDISDLVDMLYFRGYEIGIETNGTKKIDLNYISSISLSPKVPRNQCVIPYCHSLKILYPYLKGVTPKSYQGFSAQYKFLQPISGNMKGIEDELRKYPDYRLGVQVHKLVGLK